MKRKQVKITEFVKTENFLTAAGLSNIWPQSIEHMRQSFPMFKIISETIESDRPLLPDDLNYLMNGPSDDEIKNSRSIR